MFQDYRRLGHHDGREWRRASASRSTLDGTDTVYGDGRDYHDSWYLLASGLTGGANGTVYRLHTTRPGPVDQKNTNGEQSFAIFADNAEGTTSNGRLPQVYGLGAMQMFSPLSAGINGSPNNSEFYLAQVPAFYAGKTLEIGLWDPGDTSPLAATLYIERPTLQWLDRRRRSPTRRRSGRPGGANSACNSKSNSSPSNTSVQTSDRCHRLGLFNGCWLTLEIPIPTTYAGDQDGWWKILYSMTRQRDVQRRHDLDGRDQGQPGPPRGAVGRSTGPIRPVGDADGSADSQTATVPASQYIHTATRMANTITTAVRTSRKVSGLGPRLRDGRPGSGPGPIPGPSSVGVIGSPDQSSSPRR